MKDAYSDYWDLPGGHVQEGESITKALRREVKEECGLDVSKCSPQETQMLKTGDETKPIIFFKTECAPGDIRCSEEHVGYQWAGGEDLKGLNLGVYKNILIPGSDSNEVLGTGDPASVRRARTQQQIPHYQTKEDGGGIAGPGDTTVGEDVHTPAIGGGKRRKVKALVDGADWESFKKYIAKVSTGGGQFVTGEETELPAPVEHKEERPQKDQLARAVVSEHGVKIIKALDTKKIAGTDMIVLSKAVGDTPYVVAGYASPVVVDQEGHRVSHEALAKDLPRFLANDGEYANIQIGHSNITVGKVIPEYTTPDGQTYKTRVDDVGLYAVAEIRTDEAAPDIVKTVIDEIESGEIRSFSISGNADNPVLMCDGQRCFYDIGSVQLYEITLCTFRQNRRFSHKKD